MEARLEDDEAAFVLRRLDGDRAPEWPSPSPPEASSNRIDMLCAFLCTFCSSQLGFRLFFFFLELWQCNGNKTAHVCICLFFLEFLSCFQSRLQEKSRPEMSVHQGIMRPVIPD